MDDLKEICEILYRRKIFLIIVAIFVALCVSVRPYFQPALYAVSISPKYQYRLEYHKPPLYDIWRHPEMEKTGIVRLYDNGNYNHFFGEKPVSNLMEAYQFPLWHMDVDGTVKTGEASFENVPHEPYEGYLNGKDLRLPTFPKTEALLPAQAENTARQPLQCLIDGQTLYTYSSACNSPARRYSCDPTRLSEDEAQVCKIEALLAEDKAYYAWLAQNLDCAALTLNFANSTGRLMRDLSQLYVVKGCERAMTDTRPASQ